MDRRARAVDSEQSSVSRLRLEQNRIFVMLTAVSTRIDKKRAMLASFAESEIATPPVLRTAVHASRPEIKVGWEYPESGLEVSDDILPDLLEALGTNEAGTIDAVELSPSGINLLNGVYAIPPGDPREWTGNEHQKYRAYARGLRVALSKSARERLGTDAEELVVVLRRVIAVAPSSVVVVIAELEMQPGELSSASSGEIEEVLHVISNRNRVSSVGFATEPFRTGIDLQLCLQDLLPPSCSWLIDRSRLFTYTAMITEPSPIDQGTADATAYRCARHYTGAYSLEAANVMNSNYSPFQSVVHSFALEGASTVFDGSTPFLREQGMRRVLDGYIWVVALACHESSHLQQLLSSNLRHSTESESQITANSRVIRDFLHFRQKHSLPLISNIEMHNEFFQRLRRSLRLSGMIHKMTADVIEAERWFKLEAEELRKAREENLDLERDRRRRTRLHLAPIEVFVAALLMGAVTFLAFDTLTRKLWLLKWHVEPSAQYAFWIPFAWAVVAMIFRGWQVWVEANEEPLQESLTELGAEPSDDNSSSTAGIALGSSSRG